MLSLRLFILKNMMYYPNLEIKDKSPEQREKERQLKKHKTTCNKNRKKRKSKK